MKKNKFKSQPSQILEGSHAIALAIKNIRPAVVSAYPITPQTHIVEDLAKFKADGEADFKYVRAESEFAAASIVAGASATGARVYSATSSQGLLLMTEVIFNIAGMRLPVVITCANRGVSAPITIWNDQQDAITIRDAGWIMLFAENHQEAVDQHIMAFKLAENLKLPVMVNIDGFTLTHSYEPVFIPDRKQIKKYLPDYQPAKGQYLDAANPVTLGSFAQPSYYMEIRQDLHNDLMSALDLVNKEYEKYHKQIRHPEQSEGSRGSKTQPDSSPSARLGVRMTIENNGLLEYYGHKHPKIILIAMGSVVGTIKDAVDEINDKIGFPNAVGVLKIKCFRPFPSAAVLQILKNCKYAGVIDKSISLGSIGPLALDVKTAAQGNIKTIIRSFIVGLGGRDVTKNIIKKIIKKIKSVGDGANFIGN